MNRAYSILTVKAVEEERRVIRGTATTPSPDRVGDIVEPLGVAFKNPMPLLWQHKSDKPVGLVKFDKPTKDGITFEAELPTIDEPGALKDRVDEAWQSVKAGLVAAVSIGFRAIEYAFLDDGGIRFVKSEVYELSLVTIPANADATISLIKSIDAPVLAATGNEPRDSDRPVKPGASGKVVKTITPDPKKGKAMKTIAEQIASFEATRVAKSARMEELMNVAAEEGVTLDAEQTEEYDGLEAEVKSIDAHLVRLSALEKSNAAKAKPVEVKDQQSGSDARGGAVPTVAKSALPKGTAFTRYAIALARGKGNLMQAAEVAKAWGDTPEVETVLKAAVAAGTTTDADWAKPLVEYQNMASEFVDLLRPQTIIGRIPGLRRVPFNIKIPRQTAGAAAQWVGESKPKPVGELAFDQITLGFAKLAGIVVLTDELVRFSNPSAEALVRQDLINTIVQTMDRDFVDPAKAVSVGVSPASITNGVTPVVASGTDADAVRADVKALFAKFLAANMSMAGAVFVMTETQALGLALMQNPLGQPEFPGLAINGTSGGTFFGLPVVLSENIPAQAEVAGPPAIPAGSRIILAKASEILLADDGQVMLDVSREASLEMDSAPTSPPTASTVMVSLWQHNMVGIRAERFINWAKRRADVVQYITGANYGG
ncbi:phage prohead protease, HK97 family/phage major capsid protein, HK97 family,TIGR01554 [Phyllobacterium sp. CL33Tsu]|uniref:phage major capsid protein n=1 Tax=Phyllobacterium sp. CL33Tsu TaxID=1798191 RepID=UPI0008EF82D9|nr:phage major capsid protein [Phyllobacterium sp. CL33Tsu]SFJ54878.1 phage prohead protease, HK97 family/phage major capsid protein, HK97 family,TIGR01554 [Phyllobacterium sp. CL33Tsu]